MGPINRTLRSFLQRIRRQTYHHNCGCALHRSVSTGQLPWDELLQRKSLEEAGYFVIRYRCHPILLVISWDLLITMVFVFEQDERIQKSTAGHLMVANIGELAC